MMRPASAFALAALFVVAPARPVTADPGAAPSPATIAGNVARGDVSHCGHYRRATALARDDVKETLEVGIHLCEGFGLRAAPRLSPRGRRWLASTTSCLMRDMDRAFVEPSMNAAPPEALLAATADSHAACYVDHGFCELSLADKAALTLVLDDAAWRASSRLLPVWRPVSLAVAALARRCLVRKGAAPAPAAPDDDDGRVAAAPERFDAR